jgi:hypothetical protein
MKRTAVTLHTLPLPSSLLPPPRQGGRLDEAAATWLYLGGLFEALSGRLFAGTGGGGGLAAALALYKHAATAPPYGLRRASGWHEALAAAYCGLLVSETELGALGGGGGGAGGGGPGGVAPGRVRQLVMQVREAVGAEAGGRVGDCARGSGRVWARAQGPGSRGLGVGAWE